MPELHWLRPWWLLSLLPCAALCWAAWRRSDELAAWRRVVDAHLIEHLLVGEAGSRGPRPVQLLALLWGLVAIALAGPSWRDTPSPFAADNGLVVLLKASPSMAATDLQPSRLDRARFKLRDLLAKREGRPTGLIVYSGSAHLVMPLTTDEQVIPLMIEDLSPELMPLDGDALADALQQAARLLQRARLPGSVLVIADSVSSSQAQAVDKLEFALPVQFLAVQAAGATVDQGLRHAAASLDAPLEVLRADERDVQAIARRVLSRRAGTAAAAGSRPADGGLGLLPLIALLALFWARRGWRLW